MFSSTLPLPFLTHSLPSLVVSALRSRLDHMIILYFESNQTRVSRLFLVIPEGPSELNPSPVRIVFIRNSIPSSSSPSDPNPQQPLSRRCLFSEAVVGQLRKLVQPYLEEGRAKVLNCIPFFFLPHVHNSDILLRPGSGPSRATRRDPSHNYITSQKTPCCG
ncbi:hypothetical protein B0J13DRAFT_14543 [Dactylonectria estremocensis]|uniref:Uncharacterized protein n=1 Tax=Dactylonectria estremocensis TaxID=1079267 RepID=A0A9P9FJF0_9HYPO|nr:hypothetical protein B0J13DRAFT_14543 [Dactylonectria estremocensis]